MKYIFILIFALVGCASTQDIQNKCLDYGFLPGTDGFAHCSMVESQREQDDLRGFLRGMNEDQRHRDHLDALRREQYGH